MAGAFDLESLKHRLSQGASSKAPPDASVAVIINVDSEPSVLLIRRVERARDPWSGQIAFPGGHISSADDTFLDAAIRETLEEVGIDMRRHSFLGLLPFVLTETRGITVAPAVFQLEGRVELELNEEVAENFWASLNLLGKLPLTKAQVQSDSAIRTVDSYNYRGHVIWGLTFRILNLLLAR
jgi:8-oxo-dGTP pyrophosphatase MutT (NUDIX family)